MEPCFTERPPAGELARRLAPRLAIEAEHHKGRRAHGRGDFLLRHDRLVGPAVRWLLQGMGLYGRGVRNAQRPVVNQVRFEFESLPAAFHGFRILQLADLHIDGLDGLAETVAAHIAALPVDLCVMTGDYRYEVDGPCDAVYPRLRTILNAVRSRDGVAAILGNHDGAEIAFELDNMGVRMLVNEAVEVQRGRESIWIAGVDDPHYYGCDDLPGALSPVPAEAFKILLAHTPEMYEEAAAADIALYLCGHTHAGQVCLPWIGPPLLNAQCPKAYARGRWTHRGVQGYTSAGIGSSLVPIRFNCPPEIVLIELAAASRS